MGGRNDVEATCDVYSHARTVAGRCTARAAHAFARGPLFGDLMIPPDVSYCHGRGCLAVRSAKETLVTATTPRTVHMQIAPKHPSLRKKPQHRAAALARWSGAVAVSSALVLMTVAAPAAASSIPTTVVGVTAAVGCEPVKILAFRGSDEKNIDEAQTGLDGKDHLYAGTSLLTNGWEGPTIQRLLTAFSTQTRADGFIAANVPVIGIGASDDARAGYPASKPATELWGGVLASAVKGATAALNRIAVEKSEERLKGCAEPTFIVTGYSQGAMAARLTKQGSSAVIGVVNVGDPFQKPNSVGNEGSAADGNGFMRWNYPWYQGRLDAFYAADIHKTAVCHEGDPICSYSWLGGPGSMLFDYGPHVNYGKVNNEATAKGKELADLAHEYYNKPTPATPRAALDTVFVIDTTGSMNPYIADSVRIAAEIGAKTLAAATDGRIGLVEYRDHGDAFVARQVVPLTSDSTAFSEGLATLDASGGGDWEEAVYSGLVEALRSDWNPKASRSVVVVGDAPAHDPEDVTGYTADAIAKMFAGTVIVPIDASGLRSTGIRSIALDADSSADRSQEPSDPEASASVASRTAVDSRARTVPAAAAVDEPLVGLPVTLYSLSADSTLTGQLAPIAAASGGLALDISDPGTVGDKIIESLDDAISAPEASLSVSVLATSGLPVFISAIDSTVSDGSPVYDFDLDNDGVYEVRSDTGVIEHTFTAAGPTRVGVRVTDARGRFAIASADVDVSPASALIPLALTPTPTADALSVTLSGASVASGSSVSLSIDGLDAAEPYGARLVARVAGADSYVTAPVTAYGAFLSGAVSTTSVEQLSIAAAPGEYDLVIITAAGRRALIPLDVTAAGAGTPTSVTPADPATGSGATIVPTRSTPSAATGSLAATGVNIDATVSTALWLLAGGFVALGTFLLRRRFRH